jgi:RNA polymerase-binding transcription factor DksA
MKKTKKSPKIKVLKKTLVKKTVAVKVAKKAPAAKKIAAPKPVAKAKPVVVPEPAPVQKTLKLAKGDGNRYKKLLLNLRDHVIDGVNFLASENLKRTSRDTSGELSGYSMHMADAGTDTFDREFALSLVSSDQNALYEIEEALKRLEQSTFGYCEQCEKVIRKERLDAVPFARLCVGCQSNTEKTGRRPAAPTATFTESADDEGGEAEDSEE